MDKMWTKFQGRELIEIILVCFNKTHGFVVYEPTTITFVING